MKPFAPLAGRRWREAPDEGQRNAAPGYDIFRRHFILIDASLYTYPVFHTTFVLIYDFDEHHLRIHFIVPARADRTRIDPLTVQW